MYGTHHTSLDRHALAGFMLNEGTEAEELLARMQSGAQYLAQQIQCPVPAETILTKLTVRMPADGSDDPVSATIEWAPRDPGIGPVFPTALTQRFLQELQAVQAQATAMRIMAEGVDETLAEDHDDLPEGDTRGEPTQPAAESD